MWQRLATFRTVVWVPAILIALSLTAGPLVMNLWAHWNWKQVPCWTSENGRFIFVYEGEKYHTMRQNFWQDGSGARATVKGLATAPTHPPNDWCFINNSNPAKGEHRLDAHQHLEQSGNRVFLSVFVLAVAFGLTWASARKKRMAGQ